MVLAGGDVLRGEIVARYDHRLWWWHPEERETYALMLQGAGLVAPTLRFVATKELQSLSPLPPQVNAVALRQRLREAGWAMRRLPLEGVSYVVTANSGYHLQEDGMGDFAWDLVRTNAARARYRTDGKQNADYFVWDAAVYAPVDGTIVELVDDAADNTPGSSPPSGAVNNLVGIHLAGEIYVYLLHLRRGTIPRRQAAHCGDPAHCLAVGDRVRVGDLLGRVGNSGVSLEPHLHVAWLYYDGQRSWSIPAEFAQLYLSVAPTKAKLARDVVPTTGLYISDAPF